MNNDADSRVTGRKLAKAWGVPVRHPLYYHDGTWYHHLEKFPGALFDNQGYVIFETANDYRNSPRLRHGEHLHVDDGIQGLPGYVRVSPDRWIKTRSPKRLHYSRLSYNSSDWQRPTGDARKSEASKTYNSTQGFGHEDWLFRDEWRIDGWRYAFIEGVNKSHARLVKDGTAFDVILFTIQPNGRRRFVATIRDIECLDDNQADAALAEFRRLGWLTTMQKEVTDAKGNANALGDPKWAKHVLNVRFRLNNVARFPADAFAAPDDPIMRLNRYMLYGAAEQGAQTVEQTFPGRAGATDGPSTENFVRQVPAYTRECTPEHARMQAKLMERLRAEYPSAIVVREEDFIDVSVRTDTELILFEIKSDLEPRLVIRNALGQIMEYAYYPTRKHGLPLRLVIVGRQNLGASDNAYLEQLRGRFSLPLSYRAIEL